MIFKLGDKEEKYLVAKLRYLSIIKNNGFNVVDKVIIDKDEFENILNYNNKYNEYKKIINDLNKSKNLKKSIEKIKMLIDSLNIPDEFINNIIDCLDLSKKYIIRSSVSNEEKYEININQDIEEFKEAIKKCYISCFDKKVIKYASTNDVSTIIVQEIIEFEYSGILFGVNEANGNDKEIVIKIARGSIENEKNTQKEYIYNYEYERFVKKPKVLTIKEEIVEELVKKSLNIQELLGFPINIEFLVHEDKIFFLQIECVKRIEFNNNIVWINSIFKDFGISSDVCTPYMWSLYKYVLDNSLRNFFANLNILKEKEIEEEIVNMFFSRPYLNVSCIKKAMQKIPGYIEKDFDDEFGITPLYDGEGKKNKFTINSIKISLLLNKMLKKNTKDYKSFVKSNIKLYKKYVEMEYEKLSDEEFFEIFEGLIQKEFFENNYRYFTQAYINIVKQTMFKKKIRKYLNKEKYLNLISAVYDVSSLNPFYDLWKICEKIKQDKSTYEFFKNSDEDKIYDKFLNNRKDIEIFDDISVFVKKYEYYPFKELNILFPSYGEDIYNVLKMVKSIVKLGKKCLPDNKIQKEKFKSVIKTLKLNTNKIKFKRLEKEIYEMRDLSYLKDEFKDLLARFYYIIRIYTLELGKRLKEKGLIKDINDIFYVSKDDLLEYIHSNIGIDKLNKIIKNNKIYYNSFKNYIPKTKILNIDNKKEIFNSLIGIGCSAGKLTARARVIEDYSKIDKICPGEILVTKFTDNCLIEKFSILGGVITEDGSMFCKIAAAARKYGIPCIVNTKNIINTIKDGDILTIDGVSGKIVIK